VNTWDVSPRNHDKPDEVRSLATNRFKRTSTGGEATSFTSSGQWRSEAMSFATVGRGGEATDFAGVRLAGCVFSAGWRNSFLRHAAGENRRSLRGEIRSSLTAKFVA
jgi:hypothetical protein